jgi:hypothetical protein
MSERKNGVMSEEGFQSFLGQGGQERPTSVQEAMRVWTVEELAVAGGPYHESLRPDGLRPPSPMAD